MKTLHLFLSFLIILVIPNGCKKDDLGSKPTLPAITTLDVSSVTPTSAVCGGTIVSDGNKKITKRGICYGTHPGVSLSDNVIEDSGSGDNFTITINGLTPYTTYYVRAFATNELGTSYGSSEKTFTTSGSPASLTTSAANVLSSTAAQFQGQITSNGNSTVSSAGFCYSTSSNPTTLDNVVLRSTVTDTFSVYIFSLSPNTTYYVRAFATNSAGTAYGSQVSFTTGSPLFQIGELYGGGMIYYVDDSHEHGYIVATIDQSTNNGWGCNGTNIPGATDSIFGAGSANTTSIVTDCGSSSAAYLCSNLSLNGYTDWFLPSKIDMEFIYQNIYMAGKGNFSTYSYWTSTQKDANYAWAHKFSNNLQNAALKNSPYSVRAIRAF